MRPVMVWFLCLVAAIIAFGTTCVASASFVTLSLNDDWWFGVELFIGLPVSIAAAVFTFYHMRWLLTRRRRRRNSDAE